MKEYLFILGRDPELSMLELVSYFHARKITYKIKKWEESLAYITMEQQNFKDLIDTLGGTSKIAEVITDIDKTQLHKGKNPKFKYAISVYDNSDITSLEQYLKQRFKQEKLKVNYKKSKRKVRFLGPIEVVKQKLLSNGMELLVNKGKIAKTIAVFNPEEYMERDIKKTNTISIRLAKILINLAGIEKGTISDPSGSGTITQESKLMGYKTSSGGGTAIVMAPEMVDSPKVKQLLKYEKLFKGAQHSKTVVLAVPRVRRHEKLDLKPIANKYGFRSHSELGKIALPMQYMAKVSRIERDIWVFKQKL